MKNCCEIGLKCSMRLVSLTEKRIILVRCEVYYVLMVHHIYLENPWWKTSFFVQRSICGSKNKNGSKKICGSKKESWK